MLDPRPQQRMGYLADAAKRLTYSASDDLSPVFRKALSQGLSDVGFEVLPAPEASATHLEIHVHSLEFRRAVRDVIDIDVVAAAQATVHKAQTQAFHRMYRTAGEYRSLAPGRRWSEEKINVQLSALMSKILADVELLAVLIQGYYRRVPEASMPAGQSTRAQR